MSKRSKRAKRRASRQAVSRSAPSTGVLEAPTPWEFGEVVRSMARFGRGSYDSGDAGARRWSSRRASALAADDDLDADTLDVLRSRSRDRYRNDGMARATVDSLSDQVIGQGLRPKLRLDPELLDITREEAVRLQRQAGAIWQEWCETADVRGISHFDYLQALVFGNAMVSGDVLVRPIYTEDARIPHRLNLKVEILEGDRLDTPVGREADPRIRNGVEINSATAAPIAYWISDRHPGELKAGLVRRRRIAAHTPIGRPNVLHVFAPQRPGQSRGEPVLAPVLDSFKDADDYLDAAVMRQYVAACFAAFVTRPNPREAALNRATDSTRGDTNRHEEINPGQINYLAPGESVSFGQPPTDGTFESFMVFVGRRLAAATGQPYEVVAKDFSKTNFSSARAALAEAIRGYRRRRSWFARQFLTPIYRLVLEEAWSLGLLELGTEERPLIQRLSNGRVWIDPMWVTPDWVPIGGTGWIDPRADAAADQILLSMGVTTRERIVSERTGGDWETDVAPQLVRESALVGTALPSQDSDSTNPEEQDADAEAEAEDEQGSDDGADEVDAEDDPNDPSEGAAE